MSGAWEVPWFGQPWAGAYLFGLHFALAACRRSHRVGPALPYVQAHNAALRLPADLPAVLS